MLAPKEDSPVSATPINEKSKLKRLFVQEYLEWRNRNEPLPPANSITTPKDDTPYSK